MHMLQRYTIRDLNTGQLYVLDGDDGTLSPDDPASPASGRVTDIIQGRQLSLDEFEQVLGLNAVLEVCMTSVTISRLGAQTETHRCLDHAYASGSSRHHTQALHITAEPTSAKRHLVSFTGKCILVCKFDWWPRQAAYQESLCSSKTVSHRNRCMRTSSRHGCLVC